MLGEAAGDADKTRHQVYHMITVATGRFYEYTARSKCGKREPSVHAVAPTVHYGRSNVCELLDHYR